MIKIGFESFFFTKFKILVSAKLFALLVFSFSSTLVNAQEWQYDFEKAIEKSQEEAKPILIYFSGSDWCKPCIKFKKEVLNNPNAPSEFLNQYVLLSIDMPKLKKNRLSKERQVHNDHLMEVYNFEGAFPKIVVINSKKDILWTKKAGFNQEFKNFVLELKNAL